jgi:glycolate oxidase FAD binding subunit
VPSTQVPDIIERVEQVAGRLDLRWQLAGRAALGILYVALPGFGMAGEGLEGGLESSREAVAVEELRHDTRMRDGSAVVVSASPRFRVLVDPWGDVGEGLPIMRALKSQFDPAGILSPGRGPGGL